MAKREREKIALITSSLSYIQEGKMRKHSVTSSEGKGVCCECIHVQHMPIKVHLSIFIASTMSLASYPGFLQNVVDNLGYYHARVT